MSRQDTQLNTIILCSWISSKIKLNTVNPVLGLSGHFKTDYRLDVTSKVGGHACNIMTSSF